MVAAFISEKNKMDAVSRTAIHSPVLDSEFVSFALHTVQHYTVVASGSGADGFSITSVRLYKGIHF